MSPSAPVNSPADSGLLTETTEQPDGLPSQAHVYVSERGGYHPHGGEWTFVGQSDDTSPTLPIGDEEGS